MLAGDEEQREPLTETLQTDAALGVSVGELNSLAAEDSFARGAVTSDAPAPACAVPADVQALHDRALPLSGGSTQDIEQCVAAAADDDSGKEALQMYWRGKLTASYVAEAMLDVCAHRLSIADAQVGSGMEGGEGGSVEGGRGGDDMFVDEASTGGMQMQTPPACLAIQPSPPTKPRSHGHKRAWLAGQKKLTFDTEEQLAAAVDDGTFRTQMCDPAKCPRRFGRRCAFAHSEAEMWFASR